MKLKVQMQKLDGSISGQNLVLLCFLYRKKLPILFMKGLCSSNDHLHCYSENWAMLLCDFDLILTFKYDFYCVAKGCWTESHPFFALDTSVYSQGLISAMVKKFSSTASRPELGPIYSVYQGLSFWGWSGHLHLVPGLKMMELYLHFPMPNHGIVLN
jgi:hypothetical protein